MKKLLLLVLVMGLVGMVSGVVAAHSLNVVGTGDNQVVSTGRSIDDYTAALKELVGADSVGKVIVPEENEVKYLFLPLLKDGKVIGYGTWVNCIIYNHPEDMIAVVNMVQNTKTEEKAAYLLKWKPLDANSHHVELTKEEYLSRFYGMTKDANFNSAVDVVAGSTYSSNTFFFELKNVLLTFEGFVDEGAIEVK